MRHTIKIWTDKNNINRQYAVIIFLKSITIIAIIIIIVIVFPIIISFFWIRKACVWLLVELHTKLSGIFIMWTVFQEKKGCFVFYF